MRKIRGITVGTTMNPEKIAEKFGGGCGDATALNEHITNTENPHQVTCEQIGAAPAGFGLGEKISPAVVWRYANQNGFSRSSTDSPDGTLWWGITSARDSGVGANIAFSDAGSILTEAKRIYKSSGATVKGEWEYVNPPMLPGVEYRTTERWKGKPVYTKLIDLPIVAENITKEDTIYFELVSGVDTIVSEEYRETGSVEFYFNFNRERCLYLEGGQVILMLYVNQEEAGIIHEATMHLKYTKV